MSDEAAAVEVGKEYDGSVEGPPAANTDPIVKSHKQMEEIREVQ